MQQRWIDLRKKRVKMDLFYKRKGHVLKKKVQLKKTESSRRGEWG
jgi:hypothetical protein